MMKNNTGNDNTFLATRNDTEQIKPKNLFMALAEIEHISLVERKTYNLSKEFLTSIGRISFTGTGVRETLVKGLISAIMIPIMFMAQRHLIMFAGSSDPTTIDMMLMLLMSTIYTLGNGILMYVVFSESFAGTLTLEAMRKLWVGTSIGKFLTVFINFCFLYWLLLWALTETNIYNFAEYAGHIFKSRPHADYIIFTWISRAREVFVPAFLFILTMNTLFIGITWLGMRISIIKTKKLIAFRRAWE